MSCALSGNVVPVAAKTTFTFDSGERRGDFQELEEVQQKIWSRGPRCLVVVERAR